MRLIIRGSWKDPNFSETIKRIGASSSTSGAVTTITFEEFPLLPVFGELSKTMIRAWLVRVETDRSALEEKGSWLTEMDLTGAVLRVESGFKSILFGSFAPAGPRHFIQLPFLRTNYRPPDGE